ncbi:MAG: hypothetical protein GY798_02330 [Hyphomicrobiales bacterium]|nr:hypothetical protein [Hyphomicrobiales bacterium]
MSADNPGPSVIVSRPAPHVALLELNRPTARNALDVAAVALLGCEIAALEADPSVRAGILSGTGGHFCAGSDIKEMAGEGISCLRSPDRMEGWRRVEATTLPMIAAIEGMALGAGLELALMADVILCDRTARFGLPELSLGVMPGDGGTQRLARAVSHPRALRMILTSEILSANAAEAAGLAQCVNGAVRDAAIEQAGLIAANAPLAARLAKSTVRAGTDLPLAGGLALEARALEVLFATQDQKEGMAAFIEKRAPELKGA